MSAALAPPDESSDQRDDRQPKHPVQLDLRAIRRSDPRFHRRAGDRSPPLEPAPAASPELDAPSSAPADGSDGAGPPPLDLALEAPDRAPAASPAPPPEEEKAGEASSPPLMERLGNAFARLASPIMGSWGRSTQEAVEQMGADVTGVAPAPNFEQADHVEVEPAPVRRPSRLRSSSTVARELQSEEDAAYAMELQQNGSPQVARRRPARERSSSTVAREIQAEEDHSTAAALQLEFDREHAAHARPSAIIEEEPGDIQEEPAGNVAPVRPLRRRYESVEVSRLPSALASSPRASPSASPVPSTGLPASSGPGPLRLNSASHSDGEEKDNSDPIRGAVNRSQSRPVGRRERDQARSGSGGDLEDLRNRITAIRSRTAELRRENSSSHRRSSSNTTPRTYLRDPRHTEIVDRERRARGRGSSERERGSSITPRSYNLAPARERTERSVLSPELSSIPSIPDSPPRNPPPQSSTESQMGSRDLRRQVAQRQIRNDPSSMASHRGTFSNSEQGPGPRDRRYLENLGLNRSSLNYSPPRPGTRSQSAAGARRLFRHSSARNVMELEPAESARSPQLRRHQSARNVRDREPSPTTSTIAQGALDLISSAVSAPINAMTWLARRNSSSSRDRRRSGTMERIENMEERATSLSRQLQDFSNMSLESVNSRDRSRARRENRSRMSRDRVERERRERRERERRRERRPGIGDRSDRDPGPPREPRRDEPLERWYDEPRFYAGRSGARRDGLNARRGRRGMVQLSRETTELFDEIDNMDHDALVRLGERIGPVVSPGAPQELIEALPAARWSPPSATATNPVTQCSVCLEEFNENDWTRCLPCMHNSFHKDCIDEWLLRKAECPICRKNIHDHPDIQRSSRRHRASRRHGNNI